MTGTCSFRIPAGAPAVLSVRVSIASPGKFWDSAAIRWSPRRSVWAPSSSPVILSFYAVWFLHFHCLKITRKNGTVRLNRLGPFSSILCQSYSQFSLLYNLSCWESGFRNSKTDYNGLLWVKGVDDFAVFYFLLAERSPGISAGITTGHEIHCQSSVLGKETIFFFLYFIAFRPALELLPRRQRGRGWMTSSTSHVFLAWCLIN
jgi:hypothetical protein